ncbi:unnamed protein product [Penicillium glandicola]
MAFIRHSLTRTAATQPLRMGAARAQLSQPNLPRRCYSTGGKLNETEPGGQRQLIIAGCVAIPVLAYFWSRGGKSNSAGETVGEYRGANQEYKESAEGNR